jgi:hypothetical protein
MRCLKISRGSVRLLALLHSDLRPGSLPGIWNTPPLPSCVRDDQASVRQKRDRIVAATSSLGHPLLSGHSGESRGAAAKVCRRGLRGTRVHATYHKTLGRHESDVFCPWTHLIPPRMASRKSLEHRPRGARAPDSVVSDAGITHHVRRRLAKDRYNMDDGTPTSSWTAYLDAISRVSRSPVVPGLVETPVGF